jgi:hypothetical protein
MKLKELTWDCKLKPKFEKPINQGYAGCHIIFISVYSLSALLIGIFLV